MGYIADLAGATSRTHTIGKIHDKVISACVIFAMQHMKLVNGIPISGFAMGQDDFVQRNSQLIIETNTVALRAAATLLITVVLLSTHQGAAYGSG